MQKKHIKMAKRGLVHENKCTHNNKRDFFFFDLVEAKAISQMLKRCWRLLKGFFNYVIKISCNITFENHFTGDFILYLLYQQFR